MARSKAGDGYVLSSTALPTSGDYCILLRNETNSRFIGLKNAVDGRNYNASVNCLYWNPSGIKLNGENLSLHPLPEGKAAISVKARGEVMLVQFQTEFENIGPKIKIDASRPVYLMG